MADRTGDGLGAPAVRWYGIVPTDAAILDPKPRGLYISTVTTCVIENEYGDRMTLVTTGYHPVRPVKVLATGTTATGIFGLY
jgi:hypothetical protein